MTFIQILKKQFNPVSIIFSALFIAGLLITVLEINIYRNTFINYTIPAAIWLLPGIIPAFMFRSFWVKYISTESLFLILVYNICTWGGFATYIFMASNFYFTQNKTTTEVLHILSIGKLAKGRDDCSQPYANIVHNWEEKEIFFDCDVPVSIFNAVELKTQTGLWGYEVIIEKHLTKE